MRKPSFELNLLPIIENQIFHRKAKHQGNVMTYLIIKKGLQKDFDTKKLSSKKEPHDGRMCLTHRYNGQFLFREVKQDEKGFHTIYDTEE